MNEPRNPSVTYERADVNVRAVVWSVTALATGIVAVMIFLVFFYARLDVSLEQRRADNAAENRLREKMRGESPEMTLPPQPRLEGLGKLPVGEKIGRIQPEPPLFPHNPKRDDVNTWRWADEAHTAACIPVAEAMKRMLEKPETYFKALSEKKPTPAGGDR